MSYPSLYIGYAPVSCTTERIKKEFDTFLQCDIVSRVDERIKTDMKGREYKIFFIHFDWVNPPLNQLFEEIGKYHRQKADEFVMSFRLHLNTFFFPKCTELPFGDDVAVVFRILI